MCLNKVSIFFCFFRCCFSSLDVVRVWSFRLVFSLLENDFEVWVLFEFIRVRFNLVLDLKFFVWKVVRKVERLG